MLSLIEQRLRPLIYVGASRVDCRRTSHLDVISRETPRQPQIECTGPPRPIVSLPVSDWSLLDELSFRY
jgi:hypothetical protein